MTILFALALVSAYAAIVGSKKEGMVEYVGAQKDVFTTGKAASVVSLEDLAGRKGLYAMGPIDGLDGEITIFDSKPYITKCAVPITSLDNTFKHGAFFLVWTEQAKWKDVPVPNTVKGYVDLQNFVKAQAQAAGIDVTKPFPFLLAGTPVEIKWHINVDRTEGKPITKELFAKSKQPFVDEERAGRHHRFLFRASRRCVPPQVYARDQGRLGNGERDPYPSRIARQARHRGTLMILRSGKT